MKNHADTGVASKKNNLEVRKAKAVQAQADTHARKWQINKCLFDDTPANPNTGYKIVCVLQGNDSSGAVSQNEIYITKLRKASTRTYS